MTLPLDERIEEELLQLLDDLYWAEPETSTEVRRLRRLEDATKTALYRLRETRQPDQRTIDHANALHRQLLATLCRLEHSNDRVPCPDNP